MTDLLGKEPSLLLEKKSVAHVALLIRPVDTLGAWASMWR